MRLAMCCGIFACTVAIHADTIISTDTTQNSGTLAVSAPGALIVNASTDPKLTLSGGATTSGMLAAVIANNSKGQLLVSDGSVMSSTGSNSLIGTYGSTQVRSGNGYISLNSGSVGVATVTGENSAWTNSQNLWVGIRGNGTLNVTEGASVTARSGFVAGDPGTTAEVFIAGRSSDVSSKWTMSDSLTVGFQGKGTMIVEDGGEVVANSGNIGSGNGSVGSVVVSGRNLGVSSKWTSGGDIHIGGNGNGKLSVEDGGEVSSITGYIGMYSGSIGEVTVSGTNAGESSKWTNAGRVIVGYNGNGTMTVENGGRVSNLVPGYIGFSSGSKGTVTVTGSGSSWTNTGDLYVGAGSTDSSLMIADGGSVVVTGETIMWPTAEVTLDGGTLDTAGFDASVGTFNFISGTLRVAGTAKFPAAATIDVGTNSTFVNATGISVPVTVAQGGFVTGDGSFADLTVNAGGTVSPGNSPGSFGVGGNGSTTWNGGGTYLWEINNLASANGIAGDDPGWDLWGTGELTFGATELDPFTISIRSLDLENNDGELANWESSEDHQWLIATATNVGGIFDSILDSLSLDATQFVGQNSDGNFELFAANNGSELWLKFTAAPIVGDYNGDGSVDAADYVVWRDSLGATVTAFNGADGSGNGLVDQEDYDLWKSSFGTVLAAGAGSGAAVPEPTTLVMLMFAAVSSCRRRR
jgi:T5SS/PEP-CTERM-associated repeat protein